MLLAFITTDRAAETNGKKNERTTAAASLTIKQSSHKNIVFFFMFKMIALAVRNKCNNNNFAFEIDLNGFTHDKLSIGIRYVFRLNFNFSLRFHCA